MESRTKRGQSAYDSALRPVIGLTEKLPKKDLEHITIEAIKKHRQLRDEAEALYKPYVENPPTTGDAVSSARLAWVSAMVNMHAQQALLSTLLDVLGYIPDIPDIPDERPTVHRAKSA